MTEPVDFTHCERLPGRAYNGAFFRRHSGDLLASSIARIAPRIDSAAIAAFIDNTLLLSDLQRRFYKVYLAARYEALFGN